MLIVILVVLLICFGAEKRKISSLNRRKIKIKLSFVYFKYQKCFLSCLLAESTYITATTYVRFHYITPYLSCCLGEEYVEIYSKMERDKTKRTATKSVINNLITKLKSLNLDDEQNNRELLSTIKVIELKMSQIEVLNEKILDEISIEDMELDIEVSTKFEIDVNTELEKFRRTTNTNQARSWTCTSGGADL